MSKDDFERAAGIAHHEQGKQEEGGSDVWEKIAYVSLAIGILSVILMALCIGG